MAATSTLSARHADPEPVSVKEAQCCIVGGGPGGMMLTLLLGRQGVRTVLLESHPDFDRDFRGDTVHPSTLEVLDQLGLAERLHQLPHGLIRSLVLNTPQGKFTMADLSRLRTRFPYVMMLPQVQFLDFLAAEARKCPSVEIILSANVQQLVREGDVVRGVRYHDLHNRWHEVRAPLTVGADGRFSRLRGLAGFEPRRTAPPMDVVWFRLPRRAEDAPDQGALNVANGRLVVVLDRADEFQIGYVIPKGGFQQLRQAGIDKLRQELARVVPWLADRTEELRDWRQVALLSVESSRLRRWYLPGLLLIGDAAHVMSPVGGVGINYAVQDAVEAANVLGPRLKRGQVRLADLAEVQRRREWPVKIIQTVQRFLQAQLVSNALDRNKPFRMPLPLRLLLSLPGLRNLPGRVVAFGPKRVRVDMTTMADGPS